MVTKKGLVIAVLATFCLTSVLFMIRPIGSNPGIGEYDPWNDLNSDGAVDIYDAINLAGTYGTSGDPTKNVTIAGHANKLAFTVSTFLDTNGAYATEWIPIDGYSKVTVCIDYNEPVPPIINYYTLMTAHYNWTASFVVDQIANFGNSLVKTYDVPNQQIYVEIQNGPTYPATVTIDVYLIP
jgi:hypothetical protein